MHWLITYDISDDRLRARIAEHLGGFGWRVQESVFECSFEPDSLPEIVATLDRELAGSEDANIRVYRLCRDCLAIAVGIGNVKVTPEESPCIIA